MQSFLSGMMLSTGIQPNLLKRWTELSETLESKINLAHHFRVLNKQHRFLFLVFPHTVQQYSHNSLINALYKLVALINN